MYLVLSALTSSPVSLVAATKASAFSFLPVKYSVLSTLPGAIAFPYGLQIKYPVVCFARR